MTFGPAILDLVHCKFTQMWLQDPLIIIEAAKINRIFYDELDKNFRVKVVVDTSKLDALLLEHKVVL